MIVQWHFITFIVRQLLVIFVEKINIQVPSVCTPIMTGSALCNCNWQIAEVIISVYLTDVCCQHVIIVHMHLFVIHCRMRTEELHRDWVRRATGRHILSEIRAKSQGRRRQNASSIGHQQRLTTYDAVVCTARQPVAVLPSSEGWCSTNRFLLSTPRIVWDKKLWRWWIVVIIVRIIVINHFIVIYYYTIIII